jgi:hypothetical protein
LCFGLGDPVLKFGARGFRSGAGSGRPGCQPKEARMKLERRIEGTKVGDGRDDIQRDDDDRYDTRHSRTLRMQSGSVDRDNQDDPLRGKSDGEILMRYEF